MSSPSANSSQMSKQEEKKKAIDDEPSIVFQVDSGPNKTSTFKVPFECVLCGTRHWNVHSVNVVQGFSREDYIYLVRKKDCAIITIMTVV